MAGTQDKIEGETAQDRIKSLAELILQDIENGDIPGFTVPIRTKNNIVYAEDSDVWVYGDRQSNKTANDVRGATNLLKMAKTLEFLDNQLEEGRSSTLRELYYLSESWDIDRAQFNDQDDSNKQIENLEVVSGIRREDMNMRPEESGASLIGPLKIKEETNNRGSRTIHCQDDIGVSGYTIPNNPDNIEFLDYDIDFALAVETGGMRDRLVENGFDEKYNCLVIHLKGQPSRSTRRITKRIHDELDVPITVFCDGDPWSYRIFGSVRYGSIKSAHLSKYLATPQAQYIGIQPEDIVEYDLPTDPLSQSDINALESELDDPRFETDYWKEQIELQLEIGKKAEQQSLASQGLDFVTETYLPERLKEMGIIE